MSLAYRLGSSSLFNRPEEEIRPLKRVVFISVEGTSTEVAYFRYVEKFGKELHVETVCLMSRKEK